MRYGDVIVDDGGKGKNPPRGVVRFLTPFAAKHGNIRLEFAYHSGETDVWRMHAPPRYLWKSNNHSPRGIYSVKDARWIVEKGLVYKATVTKWYQRYRALRDLPLRVRKLRGTRIPFQTSPIYPDGTVSFLAPRGFVWKVIGDNGYWTNYKVGDEKKALKVLRGGLVKA